MRVGVLWMLMVCLSDGEVTKCSVQQIITVSKLCKVNVSCPAIRANSLRLNYQLLFNDSCINQIHLDKDIDPPGCLFTGHFEVTATDNGVFICRRDVIYPPPFIRDCHTTQVKVEDKESLSAINASGPAANLSCPHQSPFIPAVVMWAGSSILLVYSLSITCVTIIMWCILQRNLKKHDEDTNVYANTRPGERRKHYRIYQ